MIVIYNPSFLLRPHTEPHAIKAAMYGFDTVILVLHRSTSKRNHGSLIENRDRGVRWAVSSIVNLPEQRCAFLRKWYGEFHRKWVYTNTTSWVNLKGWH
jgi:hypothetical protein